MSERAARAQMIGQCPSNWLPNSLGGIIQGPHVWHAFARLSAAPADSEGGVLTNVVTHVYCLHCLEIRHIDRD